VTLAASVEGRERARLFCALRLPGETLEALSGWQAEHIRGGRTVPREHLHITLAFLGHRPVHELESILGALRGAAAGAGPIRLVPERYRGLRIGWGDVPRGTPTRNAIGLSSPIGVRTTVAMAS